MRARPWFVVAGLTLVLAGSAVADEAKPPPARDSERIVIDVGFQKPVRWERRWAVWKPWVVAGSGAAVALLGVPVYFMARSDYHAYDEMIAEQCPAGCPADQLPDGTLHRARAENVVAVTLFAAGGAVAVTGLVLAIINEPRPVEDKTPRVVPVVAPGVAGAAVTLSY